MKSLVLTLVLCSTALAFGQTESRTEKKYQRYENGELIEDRNYVEENGRVISGEDFDLPDFDAQMSKMETHMADLEQRMNDLQKRADSMMNAAEKRMDLRMNEATKRMEQKQREMQERMQELEKQPQQGRKEPQHNSGALGTVFKT